jgi:hypothetical protein
MVDSSDSGALHNARFVIAAVIEANCRFVWACAALLQRPAAEYLGILAARQILVAALMSYIPDALLLPPDFWFLLAMPLLAAVLGGLSNFLSWRLLFGVLPVPGRYQQGIVSAHAEAVAGRLGDALLPLVGLSELFRLMEPEKIAAQISDRVLEHLDDYVDAIMSEKNGVLWDNLPVMVRRRVYERVRRQLPSIFDNFVDDLAENIEALIDVRSLVQEQLVLEPVLLRQLFEETLRAESYFLLRAGVLAGLFLGLAELLLWRYMPNPYLLPVFAVLIALGSQWLPRLFLFWPVRALKVGPFLWQGQMLRHRLELSRSLAYRLGEDVLSLRRLMQALLSGARAGRTRTMIKRHMRPLMESGLVRTSIQLLLGAAAYVHIKQRVVDRAVLVTMETLSDADFNHHCSGQVQSLYAARLEVASSLELTTLLRSVLDEAKWLQWIVIAGVGAVLGTLQWLALVAG